MPELPDVEVHRRRFEGSSLGRTIEDVEVRDEYLVKGVSAEELAARLAGREFASSRRHGKYLFAGTDSGLWVLFHFGMSGFLQWFDDPSDETEYPKVLWRFEGDGVLVFDCRRKLGAVRLLEDPDEFVREKELGPDAHGEAFDRQAFREAMIGRRGMLKTALMNQQIMAGIGNEFSDEILFQRQLHPKARAARLDDDELDRVYDTMRTVLEQAIGAGMDPDRLPERFLLPHREEGGSCPRCGGEIARTEVSGRGSYYCPECQAGAPEQG